MEYGALERICKVIRVTICHAGNEIEDLFNGLATSLDVSWKDDNTPVTVADHLSQKIIYSALRDEFPNIPFVLEEEEVQTNMYGAQHIFLVDPLDGTSSFARGFPNYSVTAALVERQKTSYIPVICVVHEPATGRIWWAIKGHGTYLAQYNRGADNFSSASRVRVSLNQFPSDNQSMLIYDAALTFRDIVPSVEIKLAALTQALPLFKRVRMIGSNALQFAYVASGLAEASVTDAVGGPYDLAGHLLVDEAGGRSSDLVLKPIDVFRSKVVVATNGQGHESLVTSIRSAYNI